MYRSPLPHHKQRHQKQRGFTLIELLVTIGILTLILGGGSVVFTQFNQRQRAQIAAYDLREFIKTAQVRARAKSTPPNNCSRLTGYTVQYSGGDYASLYAECDPDGPQELTGQRHTISSRLTVSTFAITFLSLQGGAQSGGVLLTNGGEETITISGDGVNYSFAVTAGGNISDPVEN